MIASRLRLLFAAMAMLCLGAAISVAVHRGPVPVGPLSDDVAFSGTSQAAVVSLVNISTERVQVADRRVEKSIERLVLLVVAIALAFLAAAFRRVRWITVLASATRARRVPTLRRGPPIPSLV